MSYYIYEIYNPTNDTYYIGQRLKKKQDALNDGYFGSSSIMNFGGWHQGILYTKLEKNDKKNLIKSILYDNIPGKGATNFLEIFEIESYRQKYGKSRVLNQQSGGNGGDIGENGKLKAREKKLGRKWVSKRSYEIKDIKTGIIYDCFHHCCNILKIRKMVLLRELYLEKNFIIVNEEIRKRRHLEYGKYLEKCKQGAIQTNKHKRELRALNPKPLGNRTKGKTYEEVYGIEKAEEYKEKLRKSLSGKHSWGLNTKWFNNGIVNIRRKECPLGFKPGKLKKEVNNA